MTPPFQLLKEESTGALNIVLIQHLHPWAEFGFCSWGGGEHTVTPPHRKAPPLKTEGDWGFEPLSRVCGEAPATKCILSFLSTNFGLLVRRFGRILLPK